MTQSVILSEAKYLKPRFFPFALHRVRMTFLVKICVNLWLNYVFFFVVLRVLVYISLCHKKSFFSVNSVVNAFLGFKTYASICLIGSVNINFAPLPSSLSTHTLPPWCSIMFFTIGSPSPVPFLTLSFPFSYSSLLITSASKLSFRKSSSCWSFSLPFLSSIRIKAA